MLRYQTEIPESRCRWHRDRCQCPAVETRALLNLFLKSYICLVHIICVYSTYLGVALPNWFLIIVARKAGELRLPGHGQGSRGEGAQADNQTTVFSIKNPTVKSSRLKGIVPRDLSPLIVEIFPSYLVFRSLVG
jgi:hypothetical protein